MRLTADVLLRLQGYLNAVQEREANLRGFQIPAIENLAVLEDQFDCLDFSDNDIKKVDNFPLMSKLSTLLFHNNRISRIASDLGTKLPNLHNLVLTANNITQLYELRALAKCPKLEHVVLLDNPVAMHPNYRSFVIYHLCCVRESLHGSAGTGKGGFKHGLRSLDYRKVTAEERELAQRLFTSEAGRHLLEQLKAERNSGVTVTAASGSASVAEPAAKGSSSSGAGAASSPAPLTAEQKQIVRLAVEAATSEEEVGKIELQLQTGQFPFHQYASAPAPAPAPAVEEEEEEEEPVKAKPKAKGKAKEKATTTATIGRKRKGSTTSEADVEAEAEPEAEAEAEPASASRTGRKRRGSTTSEASVEGEAKVEPVNKAGKAATTKKAAAKKARK